MDITTVQIPLKKGSHFYFGRKNIIWRILQVRESSILVISNSVICNKAFDDQARNVGWEKSSIRNWLNTDFWQDAFTEDEKKSIQDCTIDTENEHGKMSITTVDKVYLLSYPETAYFSDVKDLSCGKSWWLRSPTHHTFSAYVVGGGGWLITGDCDTYVAKELGVRPVISIDLQSEYMKTRVVEINGEPYIESQMFYAEDGVLKTVLPHIAEFKIPENIHSVSEECFARMTSIQSVTMPNSVVDIHEAAFKNCSNLKEVVFSKSLSTIHSKAFSGCVSLSEIVLPASVRTVSSEAFEDCVNLKNVIATNAETNFESKVFSGCRQLTGKNGYVVFNGKLHLYNGNETSIRIPADVSVIAQRAFSNCTLLHEIILPSTVTQIEDKAFMGCESLFALTAPNELIKQINSKTIKLDQLKRIRVNDISQLTAKLKPIAAVTFAKERELYDLESSKSHLKYIRSNVGKISDFAVKNPELLQLIIDEELIKKKDLEIYEKAAKATKNKTVIAMVKSIKS